MRLGIIEVDRRCLATSLARTPTLALHALSRDVLAIQSIYYTTTFTYFPSTILVALLLQLFPHFQSHIATSLTYTRNGRLQETQVR
jgi:hypothetical protein